MKRPNPFNRYMPPPPKPAPGTVPRHDAGIATRRVRQSGRIR